ncbi:hypothetical protein T08_7764 [Trichinella sp. T8]|nr:hypothetical protein T08_7764 [Trichinella sp. T8]
MSRNPCSACDSQILPAQPIPWAKNIINAIQLFINLKILTSNTERMLLCQSMTQWTQLLNGHEVDCMISTALLRQSEFHGTCCMIDRSLYAVRSYTHSILQARRLRTAPHNLLSIFEKTTSVCRGVKTNSLCFNKIIDRADLRAFSSYNPVMTLDNGRDPSHRHRLLGHSTVCTTADISQRMLILIACEAAQWSSFPP